MNTSKIKYSLLCVALLLIGCKSEDGGGSKRSSEVIQDEMYYYRQQHTVLSDDTIYKEFQKELDAALQREEKESQPISGQLPPPDPKQK